MRDELKQISNDKNEPWGGKRGNVVPCLDNAKTGLVDDLRQPPKRCRKAVRPVGAPKIFFPREKVRAYDNYVASGIKPPVCTGLPAGMGGIVAVTTSYPALQSASVCFSFISMPVYATPLCLHTWAK
jgi:hypothetical protein